MNCRIKKEYPKIKVERKNKEVADILSYLYASNKGFFTIIHQYLYETIVVSDEEVRAILKDLLLTEINHFEILGKFIIELGSTPVFATKDFGSEIYWNSDFIYYDRDIDTIVEINLEWTRIMIYNLQMSLTTIEDMYVKEMLKRFLEDEYLHLEIFTKLSKE